ncbi:hypothetical protein GCM10027431_15160 [Lysobacter rhizosphaerae]
MSAPSGRRPRLNGGLPCPPFYADCESFDMARMGAGPHGRLPAGAPGAAADAMELHERRGKKPRRSGAATIACTNAKRKFCTVDQVRNRTAAPASPSTWSAGTYAMLNTNPDFDQLHQRYQT